MITVNTYWITERAVYEGVALGIQKLTQNPSAMANTEQVIDTVVNAVMSELSDVFDFGIQPVRFSQALQQKMWEMAQQQQQEQPPEQAAPAA